MTIIWQHNDNQIITKRHDKMITKYFRHLVCHYFCHYLCHHSVIVFRHPFRHHSDFLWLCLPSWLSSLFFVILLSLCTCHYSAIICVIFLPMLFVIILSSCVVIFLSYVCQFLSSFPSPLVCRDCRYFLSCFRHYCCDMFSLISSSFLVSTFVTICFILFCDYVFRPIL